MSAKLLHATLVLGSAGATAAGSYASYGSYYGTGVLSNEQEKSVEQPVEKPTEVSNTEATQPTTPVKQPEAPVASLPAKEVETPAEETEKQKIEKLLKGEDYKACTFKFKVYGTSDYREINQLKDDEVTGLLAFLTGDDKNGLCPKLAGNGRADSTVSREELINGKGEGYWEQAEDEKTGKEKIEELLKTEKFKSCTFKFKAKNSNEYKEIGGLGEDEVGGLYDFLSGDKANGLCPVMAGQREVDPNVSREEKIDAKEDGTWEQAADEDESES